LASERDRGRGPGGGKTRPGGAAPSRPRCGLCGKTAKLTSTRCCRQWICDDEQTYVLFSYARNSCHRNHRRFTLCGYHHAEGHRGSWKECGRCRRDFETEIYVYYGTNEYNFEKLENPPAYEPTRCSRCQVVIVLSEGGYSQSGRDYWCEACTEFRLRRPIQPTAGAFARTSKPTAPAGRRRRSTDAPQPNS
jgi:hypothetical protein